MVATDKTPATAALRRGRRATGGSLATRHPGVSAAPTLNASDKPIIGGCGSESKPDFVNCVKTVNNFLGKSLPAAGIHAKNFLNQGR
jgi:hypothetical protein